MFRMYNTIFRLQEYIFTQQKTISGKMYSPSINGALSTGNN